MIYINIDAMLILLMMLSRGLRLSNYIRINIHIMIIGLFKIIRNPVKKTCKIFLFLGSRNLNLQSKTIEFPILWQKEEQSKGTIYWPPFWLSADSKVSLNAIFILGSENSPTLTSYIILMVSIQFLNFVFPCYGPYASPWFSTLQCMSWVE